MWHVSLLTKEEDVNLQIWPPLERWSWRGQNNQQENVLQNLLSHPAKRHSCHLTRITNRTTKRHSHLRSNTYWKAPMQWRNVLSIELASHVERDSVPPSFLLCSLRYDPQRGRKLVCVDSLTSAKALTSFTANMGGSSYIWCFPNSGNFYTDMVWIGFAVQEIGDTRRWVQKGLWCRRKWVLWKPFRFQEFRQKLSLNVDVVVSCCFQ